MKESIYKSYDELPLFLNADTVAKVLGVSPSSGYELLHEKDFPSLKIGSRGTEGALHPLGGAEYRRRCMNHLYPPRDPIKNFFPLPNELFHLELDFGEIAVYAYLMYRENRKDYTCVVSYREIGDAVSMSKNTVSKYVAKLEARGLIETEPTSVITRDGLKGNGKLRYRILPIRIAVDRHNTDKLARLERDTARYNLQKEQARKDTLAGNLPPS